MFMIPSFTEGRTVKLCRPFSIRPGGIEKQFHSFSVYPYPPVDSNAVYLTVLTNSFLSIILGLASPRIMISIAAAMNNKSKLAVLIPCYNEEITIGKVIQDFRAQLRIPSFMYLIIAAPIARRKLPEVSAPALFRKLGRVKDTLWSPCLPWWMRTYMF